ncbi:MAG: glucose-1-phosphate adenylyltransferase [Deltaproteobacteria bacterium]|nr:MAG: glucose-1-phosphate adenylyltransferase [Deltaproteobacteria bacterium]
MNSVVMILAGGKGSRLGPLTTHRAKPAVPFGGRYRIIDFVLSNFVNSGHRHIYVLTQYMASSLIKHLNRNWNITGIDAFIEEVPAQMRTGGHWYLGTADAVYQNLNLIWDNRPENVCIFGGDHIYKFDVGQLEAQHERTRAHLTIAAFAVPAHEAHAFGVIQVDEDGRIIGFQEKPEHPSEMPGRPGWCLVSMGNYIFRTDVLTRALIRDATEPGSSHDFGKDIIPKLLAQGARLYTFDFGASRARGEPEGVAPYWRDVGTVESYYQANMELRSPVPTLNLYNRKWRIRTAQRDYPPARFVSHHGRAPVTVHDSLVCEGSIIQSATVRESLIGYDCFIHAGAHVEGAIFLAGCDVGEEVTAHRVLADKNCRIASGTKIGVDPDRDRDRFPFISSSGIIVLPKGTFVPPEGPIEFAFDLAELLANDPATAEAMRAFEGRYTVSDHDRHSYTSMGPRYRRKAQPSDEAGRLTEFEET